VANEYEQPRNSLINKICGFLFFGFLIFFALVEVSIAIAVNPVIGVPLAALMLFFGVAFVCSIIIRAFRIWSDARWQFSLRSLLLAITLVAVVMGVIVYAAR
jgi:hypothetical protein